MRWYGGRVDEQHSPQELWWGRRNCNLSMGVGVVPGFASFIPAYSALQQIRTSLAQDRIIELDLYTLGAVRDLKCRLRMAGWAHE
ncbi:hypothetical protein MELA_01715 [Candidatus Methylomirabilis lanthanidiphila]|uniref:Uncharacterized protein n=1 Tax=Candidatus Methylomirabilis lanthanidiphila TaxID=2211376 RepID=A0A564ZKZ8_9BACT|nr:hypothetical protein MELA_01715 [Candidatus Methylomirabilis lanthanidiphila]